MVRFPKRSSIPLTGARGDAAVLEPPGGGIPAFFGLSEYGARFGTEFATGAGADTSAGAATGVFENEDMKSSISISCGGGAKLEGGIGGLYWSAMLAGGVEVKNEEIVDMEPEDE